MTISHQTYYVKRWYLRVDTITGLTATVSNLKPGSTHTYAVTAVDAAGNESLRSASLQVRLPR